MHTDENGKTWYTREEIVADCKDLLSIICHNPYYRYKSHTVEDLQENATGQDKLSVSIFKERHPDFKALILKKSEDLIEEGESVTYVVKLLNPMTSPNCCNPGLQCSAV